MKHKDLIKTIYISLLILIGGVFILTPLLQSFFNYTSPEANASLITDVLLIIIVVLLVNINIKK